MAKWSVMFVVSLLLVASTARNVPSTETPSIGAGVNHEQTNTVTVPNSALAPTGRKGVKDKKCGILLGGAAGAAGVGGMIPLGGLGGLGGASGLGGLGGAGGLGGVGGLGGAGGVGGGAAGGKGGVGGVVVP